MGSNSNNSAVGSLCDTCLRKVTPSHECEGHCDCPDAHVQHSSEDVRFYSEALIGAAESMLDRGALSDKGTDATREVIKRLRGALANTEDSAPPIIVAIVRGGIIEETYSNRPVTVLTIDYDIDGAEDSDLHTLPDGQQVLTSLTAATISDLSDYQPLLAHLPTTEPTEACGGCNPGLEEPDIDWCYTCRPLSAHLTEPTVTAAPATPGE